MTERLLIVERVVLESLERSKKNIMELILDTKLTKNVIENILGVFVIKEIVDCKNGIYSLNKKNLEWIQEINSSESVKEEVKDLVSNLVNEHFCNKQSATLGMKKVWLTPYEEKLFNNHIKELNKFIDGVELKKKQASRDLKLCESKIVFWATSDYATLVSSSLANI